MCPTHGGRLLATSTTKYKYRFVSKYTSNYKCCNHNYTINVISNCLELTPVENKHSGFSKDYPSLFINVY